MVELLALWAYLFLVNWILGAGALRLITFLVSDRRDTVLWLLTGKGPSAFHRTGSKAFGGGRRDPSSVSEASRSGVAPSVIAGVVTITVYAQAVSLFSKVGMGAHLFLLLLTLLSGWFCRKELFACLRRIREVCFSWEGAVYLIFIVMTAYLASRGLMHTDTGIYHAQAIRWYEEYGLVKGQGNLQQHFAYNSAYLGYAAIFSMKWLLGRSLHATTGFLQAFLCVWALYGLKNFRRHENHAADFCRLGILLYAVVIAESVMSPATDFGTMYLVFYIVTRWASLCAEEKGEDHTDRYSLLCVAVVCVTTYKLSAGLLVVLALVPAVTLIKRRDFRRIAVYIVLGILVLLPFLIRNVLLSGWLLYPFPAVDLFRVDWKIPAEYVQHDSDQIKVWGRCLFDVGKIGAPVKEWLPVWWEEKATHEKMLLIANAAALASELVFVFHRLWTKKKIAWEQAVLHVSVLSSIVGWFFLAPFIRYGLAFLLLFPLLSFSAWIGRERLSPCRIAGGFLCAAMFFGMSPYWDYYVNYDVLWVRTHLKDPYYLHQQDYDRVDTKELKMGELTVFYPVSSDNISYHAFPGTAYEFMAERSELRGRTVKDGFRAK